MPFASAWHLPSWHAPRFGRYGDAVLLEEKVVTAFKSQKERGHPDTPSAIFSLAMTYGNLGRHSEALVLEAEVRRASRSTPPQRRPI